MNEQASGLIDIIEPATPVIGDVGKGSWVAAALAILLLLITALLLLLKKKWPAYRAIKRLRKLHRQITGGVVSPQDGVVLLTQELRHGLNLAQQLPKQAPKIFMQQDKRLWEAFVQHMDELRYQPGEALTMKQLDPIVTQIETWLRRYCI